MQVLLAAGEIVHVTGMLKILR